MEKFNIIPRQNTITEIEAHDENDAMVAFAATMDSDMNTYFRAVPAQTESPAVVVVSYTFDDDKPVWIKDTYEEACLSIKENAERELRIELEENQRELGIDVFFIKTEDAGGYCDAKLTVIYKDGKEGVTEWTIGRLCK